MADLKDSGRIGIGVGPGLSIDAKLGDLTHPALGALGAAGMVGFESRAIDGSWYEARVSDPYTIYWLRREGQPWGFALNSSGWRGTWESLGFLDALDELDEPIDQEALPETGTIWQGELLDGELVASRWLPLPGGPPDTSKLWTFNTATDLQLGVHFLFVNARVGFNPLEFLDLLLGFGGYDIAGDD